MRPLAIPDDPASLALGQHIAHTRGCVDCHSRDFGGGKVMDDSAMGRIFAPNLTGGRGGVVTGYQDGDWILAVRHGVSRSGRGLFVMPSEEYSRFSDEDLASVIAYLKSLPPVDRDPVPMEFGPVTRVLLTLEKMKLSAEIIDHSGPQPATVAKGPTVEYGRYVANGCSGCHGPNFSGGKIEIGPQGWPPAGNLTMHESSNLPRWTELDFMRVIREGRRPDGAALDPVMPRGIAGMDDVELRALWLFFKSLPPAATGIR